MSKNLTHTPSGLLRARGLSISFDGTPGALNAITDVDGVSVGYATMIKGEGKLNVGAGPVRTGVTAILPRPVSELTIPLFAGFSSFNGNGEMSGTHYIEEAGIFAAPITITNTHACGVTRDATIEWMTKQAPEHLGNQFALPVAAETYDGFLNDINGFHITKEVTFEALDATTTGSIEEGSVGGGTGMKAYGFKAGSGTSSRMVKYADQDFTVGIFVQANFGRRAELMIRGNFVGKEIVEPAIGRVTNDPELSSIIVVVATDAPLLPHQLKRIARRCPMALARTGTVGHHGSGDIFLAFSTSNQQAAKASAGEMAQMNFIPDEALDPFFKGTVEATEEAILNSLIANQDMTGRDGNFVPALPHEALKKVLGL
jgi:D-aminopeptidase